MAIDLKLTIDGELVLGPDGDLALVAGDEQIAQECIFRLKTTQGDWTLSPTVGCNLERFIGAPNEISTHTEMEKEIQAEISRDGLASNARTTVIPVSENEVLIVIEIPSIEDPKRNILISGQFDMRTGLVYSRLIAKIN